MLASGAIFAGYTVVRMLSSGATGDVYLAQRPDLPGWQALKVLPSVQWADGEFRGRFHRETEIAASLYHPNVVGVHGRGEFDGQLWVALDYVDGRDAAQLMADRVPAVLPVGEVLAIITGAAVGLDFAHQHGMLHRDVRPANIVVTTPFAGEPRIMLTDFGLARPSGESAYAAPEEAADGGLDGRTDQYSLAATALHLFTGAPPAPDAGGLGGLPPELSRLGAALSQAMADEPADRFGSCREFAVALTECAGIPGGHSPDVAPVVPAPVEHPAVAWPELSDVVPQPIRAQPGSLCSETLLQSAVRWLTRRLEAFPVGRHALRWRG